MHREDDDPDSGMLPRDLCACIKTHVSVKDRLLAIILVVSLPLAGVMGYIWWQSLQEGHNLAIAQLNADYAVVKASRSGGSGIVPDIGIDGLKRIYVYKTIPEMGWRVYVGIEETVLFAGYREQLLFGSLLFFAVVTLSLVYAFYQSRLISRPLENLVEMADAVAVGDHTRRASIEGDNEISREGQHLNGMLDALAIIRESLHESYRRQ